MSYADVQKAILLVVGLYLLFQFVEAVTIILFLFFAVFLLAMALNPVVTWLCRYRISRTLGAVLLALAVLLVVGLLGWLIVPAVVAQTQQFILDLPGYIAAVGQRVEAWSERFPFIRRRLVSDGQLVEQVAQLGGQLLAQAGRYTITAAGAFAALLLVLILTIYTLARPRPLVEGLLGAVPTAYREQTRTALVRIARQVRAWVVASLLMGAIIGTVVWIGLALLDVPNSLLLAVLAFFGEFIPNFGPVVAAIPAVLVAFAVSPLTALWVALLYLAIQQLDSYLLSPLIIGGSLELHPVTIAFFVLVMGALVGITGAILAVPIAAIIKILYEEFYYKPRHPDQQAIGRDADAVIAA
ncbi:MAG: AI-2E family transporter [Armatimonadetes bacterium]|nr:AI-2E family transporter [Armatimonadota bacterium]